MGTALFPALLALNGGGSSGGGGVTSITSPAGISVSGPTGDVILGLSISPQQTANSTDNTALTISGGNFTLGRATTQYPGVVSITTQGFAGLKSFADGVYVTQTAGTGTQSNTLTVTGPSHTALTASTEYTTVSIALGSTIQFATGTIATQRSVLLGKQILAAVGASTITFAATMEITGAPQAGTNVTLTEAVGLRILTGAVDSKALVLKMASSQTASPFEVQNSSGTALMDVNSSGNVRLLNSSSMPLILGSASQGLGIGFGSSAVLTLLAGGTSTAAPISIANTQVPGPGLKLNIANSYTGTNIAIIGTSTNTTMWALNQAGTMTLNSCAPVYTPISPTALSADTNNYVPAAGGFLRLSTNDGTSRNLTGLVPANMVTGMRLFIVNLGSGNIVLKHQDTNSTAANRFLCSTAADITLSADQGADLYYDGTTQRWRVFKKN